MLRILTVLVVLLAGLPATAQMLMSGAGPGSATATGGGGGGYSGPGDVVASALYWYGLRAYTAAYASATGNIAIFRRSSDNATCTGIANSTSGNLDLTTAYCSGTTNLPAFCGASGGNCFAATLYDQSGGNNCSSAPCNVTQATAATQPQLVFNCINTSLPCLQFAGAQVLTSPTLTGGSSQPFTASFAAKRTGTFTANNGVAGLAGTVQMGFSTTVNTVSIYAGATVTQPATDSAFHAVQGVYQSTTSTINVNGTLSGSLNAGANIISSPLNIGALTAAVAGPLTGQILEVGIWTGAISAGNQTALCHNQFLYWATSTSC